MSNKIQAEDQFIVPPVLTEFATESGDWIRVLLGNNEELGTRDEIEFAKTNFITS